MRLNTPERSIGGVRLVNALLMLLYRATDRRRSALARRTPIQLFGWLSDQAPRDAEA